MALDVQLFYAINGLAGKSHFWDQVMVFFAEYAIWIFGAGLVVYFFVNRKVFWIGLSSVILSRAIFTELIRYLFPRERPFLVLQDVKQLIEKNAAEPTFPSGHAAILFALAFSVYLFDKKMGVILMIVALILAFARIFVGVHYPSDILGGIIVAAIAVYLIRRIETKWRNS